jgi:hypothetical protein
MSKTNRKPEMKLEADCSLPFSISGVHASWVGNIFRGFYGFFENFSKRLSICSIHYNRAGNSAAERELNILD